MAAWVKLATLVVQAEFPDFELVGSLSPFGLEGDDAAETKACLNKIALAWNVDRNALEEQYNRFRPIAVHCKRTQGVTITIAWAKALGVAHGHHKQSALSAVLQRMAGISVVFLFVLLYVFVFCLSVC
jgi:hypothetical protein